VILARANPPALCEEEEDTVQRTAKGGLAKKEVRHEQQKKLKDVDQKRKEPSGKGEDYSADL
jgi:hypothetical protein